MTATILKRFGAPGAPAGIAGPDVRDSAISAKPVPLDSSTYLCRHNQKHFGHPEQRERFPWTPQFHHLCRRSKGICEPSK